MTTSKEKRQIRSAEVIQKSQERTLYRSLRVVFESIDRLLKRWWEEPNVLAEKLTAYEEKLTPFANKLATKVVTSVIRKSQLTWADNSREISEGLLKNELLNPKGALAQQIVARQAGLIRSLPADAARRVVELAAETVTTGARGADLQAEILKIGGTTRSQAALIARTEVSTAQTELTKARSLLVGAATYTWVTAGDVNTRPSHKLMNGRIFRWDSPPILSDGNRHHPGQFPNCRCIAIPIIE